MRMCGLNRARHRLAQREAPPELLLQFGVLCDECSKCCEGEDCRSRIVNVLFPRDTAQCDKAYVAAVVDGFLSDMVKALGTGLSRGDWMRAIGTYLRLVNVEKRLALLNSRRDCRPLDGNSFALAQDGRACGIQRLGRRPGGVGDAGRRVKICPRRTTASSGRTAAALHSCTRGQMRCAASVECVSWGTPFS